MNIHEQETAQKIVRALDLGSRDLSSDTVARLTAARGQALDAYREVHGWQLAWSGQRGSRIAAGESTGLRYALPIAVLILGLTGIIYWQSGNGKSNELADLDVRLLTDELPIDAYLDKGFDSWLKRQSR